MYAIALIVVGYFYVRLGIWTAKWAKRKFQSRKAKWLAVMAVAAIFVLIPIGDEVGGRIYFNHLCATEAGAKVYQTVELPGEYWDEKGKPRFFNRYGYLDHDFWVKRLDESDSQVDRYSSVFSIDKDVAAVRERTSQKVLGEVTTFRYWGGWMRRFVSPHNTANSCEFVRQSDFSRSFYGRLFKPAQSSE